VDTIGFDAATKGELDVIGVPVKFGDTQATIRRRPPLLGEHTEEILGEIGITGETVDALRQMSVI